jgi:hypothetical protein
MLIVAPLIGGDVWAKGQTGGGFDCDYSLTTTENAFWQAQLLPSGNSLPDNPPPFRPTDETSLPTEGNNNQPDFLLSASM